MADANNQANADEGADPADDIKKQNPGERTSADAIDPDDPHKVEKLSKLGHAGDEAAAGAE